MSIANKNLKKRKKKLESREYVDWDIESGGSTSPNFNTGLDFIN
jgi:hypothetical protein